MLALTEQIKCRGLSEQPNFIQVATKSCHIKHIIEIIWINVNPVNPVYPVYRKTGVCRGIPNFLIFDPKHTLWVLARQFFFPMKFSFFAFEKKNLHMLHGRVFVMEKVDNYLAVDFSNQ